jgi:hypothetical protein
MISSFMCWADLRDIKAAGLLSNGGVYVGAWRDKRGTIHTSQEL